MINRNKFKIVICTALGWDELRYQMLQFETGMHFLEMQVTEEERVKKISRTRSWWSWWTNQWALRDKQFCNNMSLDLKMAESIYGETAYDLYDLYLDEHDIDNIKVYPHRAVKHLIEQEITGKLKIK